MQVHAGHPFELQDAQFEVGDAGDTEQQAGLAAQAVAELGDAFARGGEVGAGRPVLDQGVEPGHHLAARGTGQVVDVGDQGGIEAGRFLQVAHGAAAAQSGELGGLGGQRNLVAEFAVEGVVGEVEVADATGHHLAGGAGLAVGPGEGADGAHDVAVAEVGGGGGVAQVDAGDAGLGQGLQFAGIGDAILVQVAPDANIGELGVKAAEEAVVVAVEVGERGKAAGGFLAVGHDGVDAEEFVAVVDQTVAVLVEGEEGVVALDPAGAGLDAVTVVVEEDLGGGGDADGFHAVAVEVDG